MSIAKLPTSYIDGVLATKRKYEMSVNSDGTVSFNDVSTFIRPELIVTADEFNNVNETINEVIDLEEDNDARIDGVIDDIDDIVSGDIQIGRVANADYATFATTATTATNASQAGDAETADLADEATTAQTADTATNATNATNAVSAVHATHSLTAGSANNEIILINRQRLNFQGTVCTIYDNRITANSVVDVFYTEETADIAKAAMIEADVEAIRVNLRAKGTISGDIVATIKVRVV